MTLPGGEAMAAARIVERGQSAYTGYDLLAFDQQESRPKLTKAVDFLREVLVDGAVEVTVLEGRAKELGISPATLQRAKAEIGAKSKKLDLARWAWYVPGSSDASSTMTADGV